MRAAQIDRQQRELQILRVRKDNRKEEKVLSLYNALLTRRIKEGCTQRWRLILMKYTDSRES